MAELRKPNLWSLGLLILAAALLAACAGGMEETADYEYFPDLAPTEEEPFESAEEPELEEPAVDVSDEPTPVMQPTLPAPTAVPTPDFGSIAYDVPDDMVRSKAVQIILLVSPSEEEDVEAALIEELDEVGQDPDNITTATIKVAPYMAAHLDAVPDDAFQIKALQPDSAQPLNEDEPTQWEWTVLPLKGGTHRLILRIDRLILRGEEFEPLKEEVHRDDVTVVVPFGLRVQDMVGGFDLKWLAGVFIFPLFFYILSRRDKNRDQ